MGQYIDFAVRYNPDVDSPRDLTKRILYSLIVKRTKYNKPTIIFISADSGEGKSWTGLAIEEILLEIQNLKLKDYLDVINIYTPLEYPTKINNILFNKDLKKVNIICIHESRELIRSKDWYKFITQAISDVNAMSRSVKRICFIIISQFVRDITLDVRYTLNYYMTVYRPLGQKARVKMFRLWKDDSSLERPILRKRFIRGYLIDEKNHYRLYIPQYLEITKPVKEITDYFDNKDTEAKAKIIRMKLEKVLQQMKIELEVINRKVDAIAQFYSDHPENLHLIGKHIRNKFMVKPEVKVMHDLTDQEVIELQEQLTEKLREKKITQVPEIENKND